MDLHVAIAVFFFKPTGQIIGVFFLHVFPIIDGDQLVVFANDHEAFVVLAVQGPCSPQVLDAMGLPSDMEYMAFAKALFAGLPLTVCRTGYTGEVGYELVAPDAVAGELWRAIMDAGQPYGVRPCGLGARDTLRTEMGYPLHGQDISPTVNPVEAGLTWAVGWKKDVFDGCDAVRAVKEAGPARRLRGLKASGRGIPRHGMTVVGSDGSAIGEVTSGTFSPTLRTGIALALVTADVSLGESVGVQVRGRVEPFEVVKPPFVTPSVR